MINVGKRHSSRVMLATLIVAAMGSLTPTMADPLNPLEFPSLGKVTLARGTYTIDSTGQAPKLVGPNTELRGTVSVTGVAVFRFDELIVNAGAVFNAAAGTEAKATRPVAFLSSGNLTFAGKFNAHGANGGIGARDAGGVGGVGRFGGSSGTDARANKPGGMSGAAIDVEPSVRLVGGNGGGGGIFRPAGGGGGGGGAGGGAIELGALGTLTLADSTVDVSGGHGGAEGDGTLDAGSGGGGGSGGAVLLHGATVTLGGTLNARGGDGGLGRGDGGGGGGGRIAIQAIAKPDTKRIAAAGGSGGAADGVISFTPPTLTATNLDCGTVPVGASVTVKMTIQNTGAAGSFINGHFPAAAAPFARVGTGIFSGLKANASATCEYTFTPTAVGAVSQQLTFLANAGPVSVTISGVGGAPAK